MGILAAWFLKLAQQDQEIVVENFNRLLDDPALDLPEDLNRLGRAFCAAGVSFVDECGWAVESIFLLDNWDRRQSDTLVRVLCEKYHLLGGQVISVREILFDPKETRKWRMWTRAIARIYEPRWREHALDARKNFTSHGHNGNNGDHVAAAQVAVERFSAAASGNGADPA